jgi:hypothetical protein
MDAINFTFMESSPDLRELITAAGMKPADFARKMDEEPQTVHHWFSRGVPLEKRSKAGAILNYGPWKPNPPGELDLQRLTDVVEVVEEEIPTALYPNFPAKIRAKILVGIYRLWPEEGELSWAEVHKFVRPLREKYGGTNGTRVKRGIKDSNQGRPKRS